MQNSLLRSHF